MGKIKMQNLNDLRVNEAFEKFVFSKKAQGVKDVTVRDYHYHFKKLVVQKVEQLVQVARNAIVGSQFFHDDCPFFLGKGAV